MVIKSTCHSSKIIYYDIDEERLISMQVSFSDGLYVILMQEDQEKTTNQDIHFSKEFPLKVLDSIWEKGRRVVCLEYCM